MASSNVSVIMIFPLLDNDSSMISRLGADSVNLLTNSMVLDGTASDSAIISAVLSAGYGASVKAENNQSKTPDSTTKGLLKSLAFSAVLLIILMYF